MCGIVGIVGSGPVCARLVEGLRRLEYRGYDSAGLAVLTDAGLERRRAAGKIANLEALLEADPVDGLTGIAHTRWATHGKPNEANAHPHAAGRVAVVHNGIIENFRALRAELEAAGRRFGSETDSEVIAQLINAGLDAGLSMTEAFAAVLPRLKGAYAVAAACADEPGRLWAAREGSPLVIGSGDGETYLGSDSLALAGWTRRVTYLDEGDWVIATAQGARIYDRSGRETVRETHISNAAAGFAGKGEYRHFMEKEIHEQPDAVARTLSRFVDAPGRRFLTREAADWAATPRLLSAACGSAYYALAAAKYWFEGMARLPMEADIASEFRYRDPVIGPGDAALFVSQSGETADTLAALRHCRAAGAHALGVINVPESTIAREVDTPLFTQAGPEIGVASTKAFTAQLIALACLAAGAAAARGRLDAQEEAGLADALLEAPRKINEALALESEIEALAQQLVSVRDVLYLGRGAFYPIALEGALKLKEISYIHAEGYAAGELKHGPIALIEEGTPVVVVAPHDALFTKTLSNVQEVAARGARVILITDRAGAREAGTGLAQTLIIPDCHALIQPVIATIPVQLLAYHAAALKGTDVDQPRNLAKSVTVE